MDSALVCSVPTTAILWARGWWDEESPAGRPHVLPADKGRTTVVIDKVQYDEKMGSLLADRKTYI